MVLVYFLSRERIRIPTHAFFQASLGKTKVENLSLSTLHDENVGGLDVSMDDAFGVCCVEPFCNLDGRIQKIFDSLRSTSDTVLQRHSVKKLHHDECLPVHFAEVVNGADIRMVQS